MVIIQSYFAIYLPHSALYICSMIINIYLLGYFRLIIKMSFLLANFHPFYQSIPSGGKYWPINGDHSCTLNWRQNIPCHNIHVYHIHLNNLFLLLLCFIKRLQIGYESKILSRIVYVNVEKFVATAGTQGWRGYWAVYYNSPKSFIITFFICWLINFGDFYWILVCWVI